MRGWPDLSATSAAAATVFASAADETALSKAASASAILPWENNARASSSGFATAAHSSAFQSGAAAQRQRDARGRYGGLSFGQALSGPPVRAEAEGRSPKNKLH